MQPRLTRSRTDRMIGGVCGGLGLYFGIDPVIVRLIFVVLAFTTFLTPLIYPILWIVMPESATPTMPLPPDARFDPMTGQPINTGSSAATGQTVNFGPQAPPAPDHDRRKRTLGLILAGVGGIILLNTVGEALSRIAGIDASGLIFPIVLVGLGIYLLRQRAT